jgi:hypothetical protein
MVPRLSTRHVDALSPHLTSPHLTSPHLTGVGYRGDRRSDYREATSGLLRTEISDPLGLDLELGVSPEKQPGTVAPIIAIGNVPDDWTPDPWGPWYFRDPEALAAGESSHTICSTALDTVLLFQSVYHTDLFAPRSLPSPPAGWSRCRWKVITEATVTWPPKVSSLTSKDRRRRHHRHGAMGERCLRSRGTIRTWTCRFL